MHIRVLQSEHSGVGIPLQEAPVISTVNQEPFNIRNLSVAHCYEETTTTVLFLLPTHHML